MGNYASLRNTQCLFSDFYKPCPPCANTNGVFICADILYCTHVHFSKENILTYTPTSWRILKRIPHFIGPVLRMGAVDSRRQFTVDLNMIYVSVDLEQHFVLCKRFHVSSWTLVKGLKPILLGCELSPLSFFFSFQQGKSMYCYGCLLFTLFLCHVVFFCILLCMEIVHPFFLRQELWFVVVFSFL